MQIIRQIGSFFILCAFTLSVVAQGEEAVLLNRRLTIGFSGSSLETALTTLSDKAGINFSYDPSLIDLDASVNSNYTDRELGFILNNLLGNEFVFQQLGNQLVIKLKEIHAGESQVPGDTLRFIRGKILDRDYGDALPYASISVQDQAFGTMTNSEGNFELKLPPKFWHDTLVFSCMGYARKLIPAGSIAGDSLVLRLRPVNIRLKEIKVKAINAVWVLEQMLEHIPDNYPGHTELMTAFYREVLTQDTAYINVSEAVVQLLKASYNLPLQEDRIRFLKGRKSPDVEAFQWVDFKMQGGPYYTSKLDVLKT
ncbi:MAG: carboxypeptidase-like regulatory domain-containing protein [Mangrovibacterium sp.]